MTGEDDATVTAWMWGDGDWLSRVACYPRNPPAGGPVLAGWSEDNAQ